MKEKSILFLALLVSIFLLFTSCKKGELIAETKYVSISIYKLFSDSPSMDVYINGQLNSTMLQGEQSLGILLPSNSGQITVSIKKHGESDVLIDTVLTSVTAGTGLTYLYNEQLGFNQFIGSNFRRPAADSIAFQFVNNFNYGSGKINVFIYTSVDGYSYTAENKIDSLMNISSNKGSDVRTLPYLDANGQRILYTVVVEDAVTGYNGTAEYLIDIGLDPTIGGWPLSGTPTDLTPGKLSILKVENFPYDENGKHYEQYSMSTIFEY
jgi:hypothetical protein